MADPIKPEVTERDRELSDKIYYEDPDKDVVTSLIAAYREECVRVMAVAMQEAIDREVDARLKAEGERDEARDWVRRMHAESQTLTCVYCGHAYPPGTSASGESVLTEHIKVCEKHPMRQAEARLRAVIEAADRLVEYIEDRTTARAVSARELITTYRRVRDAQASDAR